MVLVVVEAFTERYGGDILYIRHTATTDCAPGVSDPRKVVEVTVAA